MTKTAVVMALVVLSACDIEAPEEVVASKTEPLYVMTATVWPSTAIPVCWEDIASNSLEHQWVREAVQRTWEATSRVSFTGWGTCASRGVLRGIHIRVSDEQPHTLGLGTQLNAVEGGMVLNSTFGAWAQDCQARRETCIRGISVHEFGHALGFAHEQARADTPDWCMDKLVLPGGLAIGAWDLDSMMNYCNPTWLNGGELSTTDVVGVQAMYGQRWNPALSYRLTNSFLGGGRSLDTYGSAPYAPFMGTGDATGQHWKLSHVTRGFYRLTNEFLGTGLALEGRTSGVIMRFVSPVDAQLWKLTPLSGGGYRITNRSLGEGRALDTYSTSPNAPFLGVTGNFSGQTWQVTQL